MYLCTLEKLFFMEMYVFDSAEETSPLFFPLFFTLRSFRCVILKKNMTKTLVVKTNYINYSICSIILKYRDEDCHENTDSLYVRNIKLLLYMSCY